MTKSTTKHIKLDWAKLLGFNQVKSAQGKQNIRAMIGGKVGAKMGVKPTSKHS